MDTDQAVFRSFNQIILIFYRDQSLLQYSTLGQINDMLLKSGERYLLCTLSKKLSTHNAGFKNQHPFELKREFEDDFMFLIWAG